MNEVTKQKLDEIKLSIRVPHISTSTRTYQQVSFNNWILDNTDKLIEAFGEEVFDKIMEVLIVDIHGFQEFIEIIIHTMISERKLRKDKISIGMIRDYHLQKEFETMVPSAPYLFWYSKYTKYLGSDKIDIIKKDVKFAVSHELLADLIPRTENEIEEYDLAVKRLLDISKDLYEFYKDTITSDISTIAPSWTRTSEKDARDNQNGQITFKHTLNSLFSSIAHVPTHTCYRLLSHIIDIIDFEQ